MNAKTTELTLPERAAVALGTAEHEKKLLALVETAKTITSIENADGAKQCHATRMTLKTARVNIEKAGKTAREDAQAFSKAVIAEEKRLTAIVESEECRLGDLSGEWEAAREAERQAKIKAEADRVSAIRGRIQEIERMPLNLVGKASGEINAVLVAMMESRPDEVEFQEFHGAAMQAREVSMGALEDLHAKAVEAEAAARRLEEVRAMLAEQKRQQEAAEAERQALARKEQEEAAAKLRAEREAFAQQQAQARAEQQARDAAAAAERKAEQDKLDAARAEFERQQRAAREAEEARQAAARAEEEKRQADSRAQAETQERARQAELVAENERLAAKAHAEAEEKRRHDMADHSDVIQAFLKTRPEDDKVKQHIRPWLVMFCRFQDGLKDAQQQEAA